MKIWLYSCLALVILVNVCVRNASAQYGPSLKSSTFFGGAGDQSGRAVHISLNDNAIYLGGANGEIVRYGIPPAARLWDTRLNGAFYLGLTSVGTTLYAVGEATPPTCGASDGRLDTEAKSLVSLYASVTGALLDCRSSNFFPYRGRESYKEVVYSNPFLYATGLGETCGFGNNSFVLSKFDLVGNLIQKAAEPGVDFNGFSCTGGSDSFGLVTLNGNLYVAGFSGLNIEGGNARPVLMKYSADLVRQWKQRPTDNPGGFFLGLTAFGGNIYAVGYSGVVGAPRDFLIEKYDEAGNRIWSRKSGGAGDDVLYAVAELDSRLYAVGSTNSQGLGGTDAVILEINPKTGATISTTLFGGTRDDAAFGIATDGTDLYVVGESRSFASPEGNLIGQNDIMLLRYTPAPPDKTPPTATEVLSPAPNGNGWNNGNVKVSTTGTDDLSGIDSCTPPVTLTTEGAGQPVSGTCTDKAGNVSSPATAKVNIDKIRPTATAHLSPPPDANGWNRTNVTVSFTGADNLSGIDFCSPPVTVTTEGVNPPVSGRCTDKAGNVSNSVVTAPIRIDKTPPVISGMPGVGCILWPPNSKLVQVAVVTATDPLLVPGSLKVTGVSNEPSDDPKNPEIVITPNGSGGYVVQLLAERLGTGTGRVYTLTAAASDVAGNTSTVVTTCTVPHDQH